MARLRLRGGAGQVSLAIPSSTRAWAVPVSRGRDARNAAAATDHPNHLDRRQRRRFNQACTVCRDIPNRGTSVTEPPFSTAATSRQQANETAARGT